MLFPSTAPNISVLRKVLAIDAQYPNRGARQLAASQVLRKVLAIDAQYAERIARDRDLPYFPVRGPGHRRNRRSPCAAPGSLPGRCLGPRRAAPVRSAAGVDR